MNKKEPERPLPPYPSKKPQLPQPMKKPLRSSVGAKPPGFPPTHSPRKPVVENGPETKKLPEKENKPEKKDDLGFDAVEPSERKLIHLTANRAKVPNKRPPSHVFLKENEKEQSPVSDTRRLSEPLLGEMKSLQFLDDNLIKTNVPLNSEGKKFAPSRPSPPSMRKADSLPKQGKVKSASKFFDANDSSGAKLPQSKNASSDVPDKDTHPHREIPSTAHQVLDVASIVQQQRTLDTAPKQKVPDGPPLTAQQKPLEMPSMLMPRKTSDEPPQKAEESILPDPVPQKALSSTRVNSELPMEAVVHSPKVEEKLKTVMTVTVSRSEYNQLVQQVQELKDTLERYNNNCNEALSDLKEKWQEERRLRIAIENELRQMKEYQKT